MKRRNLILSVLALLLIACAVINPAVAYFTANTSADGAIPLYFYRETEIYEEMDGLNKLVTIKNTGGDHPELADPVWIRARAYISDALNNDDHFFVSGDSWDDGGDGWYYFNVPVPVGGSTTPLKVEVKNLPVNEEYQENDEYYISMIGVGVIYQSVTAFYDVDGIQFQPADWTAELKDVGETTPSGG